MSKHYLCVISNITSGRTSASRLLLLALLGVLAPAAPASAQAGRGEIAGEVRDPSGALVPGARVTALDVETGRPRLVTTGPGGLYVLPSLRPARYRLEVEAPGFRTHVRDGLLLKTGERVRVDVALEPGRLRRERHRHGRRAPPEDGAQRRGTGDREPRGRAAPPERPQLSSPSSPWSPGWRCPRAPILPRINGGRPRVNEYIYDGISVLQPEPGTVPYFPIIDAIQEFRVVTNSPPAEFGRFNGGVINLSTKSGSNELRGSAWEFLRNEALNARNLFAPQTEANPDKPRFRRNQFGFVLGGPLGQGPHLLLRGLPGQPAERGAGADLHRPHGPAAARASSPRGWPGRSRSSTTPRPPSPFRAAASPASRSPATRSRAPASIPPPPSLLDRYPLPNLPGTANNYRRLGNEDQDLDQFDVRVDHRASERDQLFARFTWARDFTDPVTPLPDGSGNLTTGALVPRTSRPCRPCSTTCAPSARAP